MRYSLPVTGYVFAVLLVLSLAVAPAPAVSAVVSPQARQSIETDWVREEQVTRHLEAGSEAALEGVLGRGRSLAASLRKLGATQAAADATKKLDGVAAKRDRLAKNAGADGGEWLALYLEARWAIRELSFANPLLAFDQLLFVRRHWPQADVHYFHHLGLAQEPGADLSVLKGLSPDGDLRSLISGKLAPGGVGRPDLSFDATRVLFSYAAPAAIPAPFHGGGSFFGGLCDKFDIYEIAIDGSGLRRLTDVVSSEETEPCYLPSGRIAFTSSRDRLFVQCQDHAPVFSMFSAAADGSDVRRLTVAKEGEWYPSMLDDGRILYTRWEYVMKPFESIQNLWTVYPDGTHAQLAYGDYYAFSEGPRTLFEARQISGTSKVLCVGAAHHNTGVGPLLILDLNKNRGGADGFVNLTPEVPFPEMGYVDGTMSDAGWYASPWPLSEDFYLVSYSFEQDSLSRNGYGVYLLDRYGNRELIYRDALMSCYAPIPVAPRKRPLIIPDGVAGRDPETPGKMILADVYQGLPGVKRGAVKYLRILESLSKQVHTLPSNIDTGAGCGLDPRAVIGTVPVDPDGSAYFTIPSDRPVFFEALDEDFLEVRRMRSFVSARPGETISCLGCHEDYSRIASRQVPTASLRPPSEMTPPPWGKGVGMDYRKLVQPVLDRHCVSCHDGSKDSKECPDFRGDTLESVRAGKAKYSANPMRSYSSLIPFVSYMRLEAYDNGVYNQGNLPTAPYEIGSAVSPLMKLLKKGHKGVKLPSEDWQLLAAWIDCNAPFYGGWDDICFAGERAVRARKAELAGAAPAGFELVGYVDCGLRKLDQVLGGPALFLADGTEHFYYVGDVPAAASFASVVRGRSPLTIQLSGVDAAKSYKLALSWWDYDGIGAIQSVTATSSDGKVVRELVKGKALPVWTGKNQMPEELVLDLPSELSSTGDIWVKITGGSGADVVLSEVWMYQSVASRTQARADASIGNRR